MEPLSLLLHALDRILSRSVPGTLLVLAGVTVAALGLLYGLALGVVDLLSSPSGPTPASTGGPFASVGVVVLAGAALATLGGQLVGYSRTDRTERR